MTDQTQLDVDVRRLAGASSKAFAARFEEAALTLGCPEVRTMPGEKKVFYITEIDGRRAIWVTLTREEKNNRADRGWTINQRQRDRHRAWEVGTEGKAGMPVMYALDSQGEIRVVASDWLIEKFTLDVGVGGASEHVRIQNPYSPKLPTLHDYLVNRA